MLPALKPPIILFDVDDTLNMGNRPGPVPLTDLVNLYHRGNIVGICGNWKIATDYWRDWHLYCSLIGPLTAQGRHYKPDMLVPLIQSMAGSSYTLVGNTTPGMGGISDQSAARVAGWNFIDETSWVSGKRPPGIR